MSDIKKKVIVYNAAWGVELFRSYQCVLWHRKSHQNLINYAIRQKRRQTQFHLTNKEKFFFPQDKERKK